MQAIAAVSSNWVIGDSETGKMPWLSHQEDMRFFVKKTKEIGNLLMGRVTYENLGQMFLKDRNIYVLSRKDRGTCGCSYYSSIVHSITEKSQIPENVIICGGAQIYTQFLAECSCLYLTEFYFTTTGDVKFPFSREQLKDIFPNRQKIKDITGGQIFLYSK